MTVRKVSHIEGYEGDFREVEMLDDTPPDATTIWFEVVSEDLPAESDKQRRLVRRNYVYWNMIKDLGHTQMRRRIKDAVEYDHDKQQWVVQRLTPNPEHSYILKYPEEWNAFMRGAKMDDYGTPLEVLFKNDPSRVLHYKSKFISTVERLSALTQAEVDGLGMGAREDVENGKRYLARTQEKTSADELEHAISQRDQKIESLTAQLENMANKLSELMAKVDAREMKGVPKAPKQKKELIEEVRA